LTSTAISAGPKPRVNAQIAFCMVLLNLCLNAAILPRWGAVGAAVSTIATELFGLISGCVYLHSTPFRVRLGIPVWLGIGICCLGVVLARHYSPLWILPACVTAYGAILFCSKAVTMSELQLLGESVIGRRVEAGNAG